MMKCFVACLGVLVLTTACRAGGLADGIYSWRENGDGPRVKRSDGAEVVLGKRVGQGFGKAAMQPVKNDNSRYLLDLKGAGPVAREAVGPGLLMVIDGVIVGVWGHSDPEPDGTLDLSGVIFGEEAARKVAKRLDVELPHRTDPGHRFVVRWTPDKESYKVGEPITLKLEIRNVGPVPFTFRVGGQQRGPRDNQFHFLAYRGSGFGKAVPDTGDPTNFGGIAHSKTLRPNETFTASVPLDKWFKFTEPDVYRVTGLYTLEMYPAEAGLSARPIWDDVAVGKCLVHVAK